MLADLFPRMQHKTRPGNLWCVKDPESLMNDIEEWFSGQCKEMEKAANFGNSCNLYRMTWNTGPWKLSMSEVIEESDVTLRCSQDRQVECWAEHSRQLFSWPTTKVALSIIRGSKIMQMVTSLPSTKEVMRATNFLKRHIVAEPERLQPSLPKNGGSVNVESN